MFGGRTARGRIAAPISLLVAVAVAVLGFASVAAPADTQPLPPAPALVAKHTMITLGQDPGLSARLPESPDYTPGLQVALAPSTEYRPVQANVVSSATEVTFGFEDPGFPELFQNASLRVGLTEPTSSGTSQDAGPATTVEVMPEISVGVYPETKRPNGTLCSVNCGAGVPATPGYFKLSVYANVKRTIPHSFAGPLADVYVRRGTAFYRLGAMRWRFEHGPQDVNSPAVITGSTQIVNPQLSHSNVLRNTYLICSPTQIVPDMGTAFTYAACGRPAISPGGPFGSEAVVDGRKTPLQ